YAEAWRAVSEMIGVERRGQFEYLRRKISTENEAVFFAGSFYGRQQHRGLRSVAGVFFIVDMNDALFGADVDIIPIIRIDIFKSGSVETFDLREKRDLPAGFSCRQPRYPNFFTATEPYI